MAKKRNWKKVITLVLLGMMVVGFSIPAFLDPTATTAVVQSGQKLCQVDSDCYLLCGDSPVEVLCSQNLCLQDSCDDNFYFKYQKEPLTFSLLVEVDGVIVDMEERSSAGDMFVRFENSEAAIFSSGLSMRHILEKAKINLNLQCLTFDGNSYCDSEKLKMAVNGNESNLFESYIPKDGDVVEIVYS